MAAVIESSDLADGGSFSWDSSGLQVVRVFIVSGLIVPAGTGHALHKLAYDAVGIVRGKIHPSIPLLPAASVNVVNSPDDNASARVTWTYKIEGETLAPPGGDFATIEVGSTVQSKKTNIDAFGNVITVSYLPKQDDDNPEPAFITQGGSVEVQVPLTTLTFTRREFPTWDGTSIGQRSKTFTGRTNLNTWQGGDPGTWLCAGINGNSTDGGQTFTVRYSFVWERDTWLAKVVFVDASGNVPADIDDPRHGGQAGRLIEVYQSIPFSLLRLPIA